MYVKKNYNLNMPCLSGGSEVNDQNGILNLISEYCYGSSDSDNCLIQGNNLDVLKYLLNSFAGMVKCVYLDPPYNNGESYLHYFDSMGHEQWIESISTRLMVIRDLLAPSGSVWISIDDSELHYLKVAADKIFGRENFVSTIIWEKRTTRENRKAFSRNHEYILVYAKKASLWGKIRNTLPLTNDVAERYKNPDNDSRGPWQSVTANVQAGHATPQQFYTIVSPSGKTHNPPKGRCWVYPEYRMNQEIAANNIWFGKDGNGVPRIKKFLADRTDGLVPETLWRADTVGTTSDAKKHLLELFSVISLFDTPKPEQLISQILSISTNPGDLVLDAYLGSGTTCAVSHKMGRKYIGIEIGSHIRTHCVSRLKKVIDAEGGGISQAVSWSGGGGFRFYKFENEK